MTTGAKPKTVEHGEQCQIGGIRSVFVKKIYADGREENIAVKQWRPPFSARAAKQVERFLQWCEHWILRASRWASGVLKP